jgi:drug/metabolite transporter (DMT)-like permease
MKTFFSTYITSPGMNLQAWILAFIVTFIYGITAIMHKVHLEKCDISTLFVIYGLVYGIGILVIAAMNMPTIRRDMKALKPANYLAIALTALAGFLIANYLYLYLLKHHQSFLISALVSAAPLFTLLFAYFFLKEDVSPTAAIAVFLIVIGVILLASGK